MGRDRPHEGLLGRLGSPGPGSRPRPQRLRQLRNADRRRLPRRKGRPRQRQQASEAARAPPSLVLHPSPHPAHRALSGPAPRGHRSTFHDTTAPAPATPSQVSSFPRRCTKGFDVRVRTHDGSPAPRGNGTSGNADSGGTSQRCHSPRAPLQLREPGREHVVHHVQPVGRQRVVDEHRLLALRPGQRVERRRLLRTAPQVGELPVGPDLRDQQRRVAQLFREPVAHLHPPGIRPQILLETGRAELADPDLLAGRLLLDAVDVLLGRADPSLVAGDHARRGEVEHQPFGVEARHQRRRVVAGLGAVAGPPLDDQHFVGPVLVGGEHVERVRPAGGRHQRHPGPAPGGHRLDEGDVIRPAHVEVDRVPHHEVDDRLVGAELDRRVPQGRRQHRHRLVARMHHGADRRQLGHPAQVRPPRRRSGPLPGVRTAQKFDLGLHLGQALAHLLVLELLAGHRQVRDLDRDLPARAAGQNRQLGPGLRPYRSRKDRQRQCRLRRPPRPPARRYRHETISRIPVSSPGR